MKRAAILVHRWLGVALCVVFLLWFPSGIAMMYWGYPSVSDADRLDRSPALDPAAIRLTPAEAYARLGADVPPGDTRLTTFDGRPAYRFDGGAIVYADTGDVQGDLPLATVDRIAASWTRQAPGAATRTAIDEVDQWLFETPLGSVVPLWKYAWPNGEQVYVSQSTGDVVQYTTAGSRLGAYAGAIPHWMYFTPLRKHGRQWSRFVIWTSGLGTFSALVGIVIGLWMYSPGKAYRINGAPTRIPYRGQKRWHTVFGLIFGMATVTWAFSGLLSMDPFPSSGAPRGNRSGFRIRQALHSEPDLRAFEARPPREALAQLRGLPVKELELTAFDGQPFYLASIGGGHTRVVPLDGPPAEEFSRSRIADIVTRAAGAGARPDVRVADRYDAYYLDRRGERPLPVIVARLNDANATRYYIDPKTARIVGSYDAGRWVTRWLYHGLHSLDFPWLYAYRPLWDIVVITCMLGGTALAFTSLVLAWRVLGRKLARAWPARPASTPT